MPSFTTGTGSTSSALQSWAAQRRSERAAKNIQQSSEAGAKAGLTGEYEPREAMFGFIGRDTVEAYNDSMQSAYISKLDADNTNRISEIAISNPDNLQGFDAAVDGMLGGLAKEVDPEVRDLILSSAQETANRQRLRVQSAEMDRNNAAAAADRSDAANTYYMESGRLARNGDIEGSAENLIKFEAVQDARLAAGEIDVEQRNELVRNAERESVEQGYLFEVSGMTTEDAASWVEENKNQIPAGFTADEWDAFIPKAESIVVDMLTEDSAQANAVTAARNQAVNDLEIMVNTDQGTMEEQLTALESLYENAPTDAKYVSLKTSILNNQQAAFERLSLQNDVISRLGGDASVVIDQGSANDVYDAVAENYTPAQKVQFADRLKFVPRSLESEIANGLLSNDPVLIANSSDMIDRLDEVRGLVDTFTPEQRAFAQQVNKLAPYMIPEEAVAIARQNTDPRDSARIDARAQEIQDKDWPDDYASKADKAMPMFTPMDQWSSPQMASDYGDLFESFYLSGMDYQAADEKAQELIAKTWSRFDGKLMKYNPSDFYSVGGSAEYVVDQVTSDLADNLWIPEITDTYLFADDRTAREASEGRPSYLVRYQTEDGWFLYPERFIPDVQAEIDRVSQQNLEQGEERRSSLSDSLVEQQERSDRLYPAGRR